jgi:imidazolonepropionase-like amidohydrolase
VPLKFQFAVVALACCLAASGAAQPVLYEGALLITDARRAPIENSAFLVENGRIVRAGRKGAVTAPAGTVRVDLTGKTVMPALIDSHIHIGYQKEIGYSPENYTSENLTDHLRRYAYAGVCAVLSLGTDPGDLPFQIRAEQETKGGTLFRLAGRGIAAPNAGPADPALKPSAYGVTTEAEARQAVREQVVRKVDFIKIWVDDRNGTVTKLSPELYRAAIDEAHKGGVRAIAHVYYLDDAKDLTRAGIDGFAHLVRDREMDDATVALIRRQNIYVMPNLGLAQSRTYSRPPAWLDDALLRETVPPSIITRMRAAYAARPPAAVESARRTYSIMQRNLAKLNAAGARIVLGADSGAAPDYFHAYNTHRELQLMVEAGMTPAQALTAATATAADFLRLKDHGTLTPGNSADFLVIEGNPLEDIANTRKIAKVFFRGNEIERSALK